MTASPMMTLYREWQSARAQCNASMPDDDRDAMIEAVLDPVEERLVAEPVVTDEDLLIRTYVEMNSMFYGQDEIVEMFERRLQLATDDPLLDLINRHDAAKAAFNAAPRHDDTTEEKAFFAVYHELCHEPPNATTLVGALTAIRLVHHEEGTCGSQPDLTTNLLAAALAYFDGGSL